MYFSTYQNASFYFIVNLLDCFHGQLFEFCGRPFCTDYITLELFRVA